MQTGILDRSSATVRMAPPRLCRRYDVKGHQIKETIDSILERWLRLRKKGFARPSLESLAVRRPGEDDDDDAAIHHSLIASENQLMEDVVVRNRLAKEKDILCSEMEAARIINRFPSMVIRRICDYSDSHKNKDW